MYEFFSHIINFISISKSFFHVKKDKCQVKIDGHYIIHKKSNFPSIVFIFNHVIYIDLNLTF